jgi:hypothetical protein
VDSALISVLTSAGAAGVFCIMFVLGVIYPRSVVDDLRKERDYERQRADLERDRADTAVAGAQAMRDVMSALQAGVALGNQRRDDLESAAMRDRPELRKPEPT